MSVPRTKNDESHGKGKKYKSDEIATTIETEKRLYIEHTSQLFANEKCSHFAFQFSGFRFSVKIKKYQKQFCILFAHFHQIVVFHLFFMFKMFKFIVLFLFFSMNNNNNIV